MIRPCFALLTDRYFDSVALDADECHAIVRVFDKGHGEAIVGNLVIDWYGPDDDRKLFVRRGDDASGIVEVADVAELRKLLLGGVS